MTAWDKRALGTGTCLIEFPIDREGRWMISGLVVGQVALSWILLELLTWFEKMERK